MSTFEIESESSPMKKKAKISTSDEKTAVYSIIQGRSKHQYHSKVSFILPKFQSQSIYEILNRSSHKHHCWTIIKDLSTEDIQYIPSCLATPVISLESTMQLVKPNDLNPSEGCVIYSLFKSSSSSPSSSKGNTFTKKYVVVTILFYHEDAKPLDFNRMWRVGIELNNRSHLAIYDRFQALLSNFGRGDCALKDHYIDDVKLWDEGTYHARKSQLYTIEEVKEVKATTDEWVRQFLVMTKPLVDDDNYDNGEFGSFFSMVGLKDFRSCLKIQ